MSTNDDYSYDYAVINNIRILTIVVASISALFPLSVVVILTQRYNSLVRGKSMVHYVMMIAIGDTMTSIAIAFGFPQSDMLCSAQAFLFYFFARMSLFFTDVLMFQLFYIVVFGKYFLNVKYMHCIVWSVNILLQLLPYTTGTTYGRYGDGINVQACFFGQGKGSFEDLIKWAQYAFNIELMLSFCMIIVLSAVVLFYSLNMKSSELTRVYLAQRIRESWSIVILYPCAMLIAWVPSMIYNYYFNYLLTAGKELPYHVFVIINYLQACQALYGPLLALIFYTKTLDARRAWMDNFRYFLHLVADVDADQRSTCSSIISVEDVEITTSTKSVLLRVSTITLRLWGSGNQLQRPSSIQNQEINPMSTVIRIPDEQIEISNIT